MITSCDVLLTADTGREAKEKNALRVILSRLVSKREHDVKRRAATEEGKDKEEGKEEREVVLVM